MAMCVLKVSQSVPSKAMVEIAKHRTDARKCVAKEEADYNKGNALVL